MIYTDIKVPIPSKKRITKNKGHAKPYVYEIVKRKGKDSPKDVVVCVGVAVSDTEMNPNEKYYDLHADAKIEKPMEEAGIFDEQIHVGGSMVLRAAAQKIGLTKALAQVFPGYEELIQSLLEYYITERESASQLFKYYLYDHYTGLNYAPTEAKLSKFFNDYLSHEKIKRFLELWMKQRISLIQNPRINIDFDSTNFNVHSPTVESAEYGKPKVDEGLPQVNVAYFLERSTGLPIYYDIYYGSIIDMEHCKTAITKLKVVNPDVHASFVMDRGYFSSPNLNYLEESGFKYLCMGKSTKEFKTMISVYPPFRIAKAENRIYGTVYGVKETRRVFQESSKEYYVYFFYDTSKITEELPYRQDLAIYASGFLVGKQDKKGKIQDTYKNLVSMELDEHQIITSAIPNYKELDKFRDQCGYFWIISNEDMAPEEAINAYRHRDMMEKTFRNIKSEADLNKVYSRSDAAFEAKSFMGFLSAILRSDITTRLRPYFIQYSGETSQTVIKEMEKVKVEMLGGKYRPRYALTNRQKQILSFYDMTFADVLHYAKTANDTATTAK